ncbi:hypothetical protein JXB02_06835 [Candidatus Woesearchaeota archaeon]|nr:hypothetical protein [Candidatus Woesearchaeota archaeon]
MGKKNRDRGSSNIADTIILSQLQENTLDAYVALGEAMGTPDDVGKFEHAYQLYQHLIYWSKPRRQQLKRLHNGIPAGSTYKDGALILHGIFGKGVTDGYLDLLKRRGYLVSCGADEHDVSTRALKQIGGKDSGHPVFKCELIEEFGRILGYHNDQARIEEVFSFFVKAIGESPSSHHSYPSSPPFS